MVNFVLDASVTLSWCFRDEATPETNQLLEKIKVETAFVPAIWSLEVGNILINAEKNHRIQYAQIAEFISLLATLSIRVDSETNAKAFHEILLLAHTEKLTTYDAAYLELAMRMGLSLATKDKYLKKVAHHLGVAVI